MCGSGAELDECGVCGGDGSSCACHSTNFWDYYYGSLCFESDACCEGIEGYWEAIAYPDPWHYCQLQDQYGNALPICPP